MELCKAVWSLQCKPGICSTSFLIWYSHCMFMCFVFFRSNDDNIVVFLNGNMKFAWKPWMMLIPPILNIAPYMWWCSGQNSTKWCDHVTWSNESSKAMACISKAAHAPNLAVVVISDVCLALYTLELSLGCWRRCAQTCTCII